jgi:GTP pyrophosphokinase
LGEGDTLTLIRHDLEEEGAGERQLTASLEIHAEDRGGLLADITAHIATSGIIINECHSQIRLEGNATLNFVIEIESLEQLGGLMSRLSKVDGVTGVERS